MTEKLPSPTFAYYRTRGISGFACAKYPCGVPSYLKSRSDIYDVVEHELSPEQEALSLAELQLLFPIQED